MHMTQTLDPQFLGDDKIHNYMQEKEMQDDVKTPGDLPEVMSEGIRKDGKIRRVVVDRAACIGARSCVVVAESAFQMDDENLAYVADGLNDTDEETIKLAAEACPVLAIHLYNKDGKKLFPEE